MVRVRLLCGSFPQVVLAEDSTHVCVSWSFTCLALSVLPDDERKKDYNDATLVTPNLVQTESDPIGFLRRDGFNPWYVFTKEDDLKMALQRYIFAMSMPYANNMTLISFLTHFAGQLHNVSLATGNIGMPCSKTDGSFLPPIPGMGRCRTTTLRSCAVVALPSFPATLP